jgi:hypothetical protein
MLTSTANVSCCPGIDLVSSVMFSELALCNLVVLGYPQYLADGDRWFASKFVDLFFSGFVFVGCVTDERSSVLESSQVGILGLVYHWAIYSRTTERASETSFIKYSETTTWHYGSDE